MKLVVLNRTLRCRSSDGRGLLACKGSPPWCEFGDIDVIDVDDRK